MRLNRIAGAVLLSLVTAQMGSAASLRDCNTFEANARNLYQPYEDATRTFANGRISFLHLWLEEPACCGAHLMVTFQDGEQPGNYCHLISNDGQLGYSSIELQRADAHYDPSRGLTVTVPTTSWNGVSEARHWLNVTINQATKEIWVEQN